MAAVALAKAALWNYLCVSESPAWYSKRVVKRFYVILMWRGRDLEINLFNICSALNHSRKPFFDESRMKN